MSVRTTTIALVSPERAPLDGGLVPGAERARAYAAEARSSNTRKTYASQWRHFCEWIRARGELALPASGQQVAIYLAERADAGHKVATLSVALAAISEAHRLAGAPSPREERHLRETWKGIRRKLGTRQKGKDPLLLEDLRRAVATLDADLPGLRDRALLLLGWAGAFRRGELAALDINEVRCVARGMIITLRRSKTDQEGEGREVGILRGQHPETCPVGALQAWLAASGLREGPLFRAVNRWGQLGERAISGHYVAVMVKRIAKAAGLDPGRLSGHSLRSGLVTTAALAGRTERTIMRTTGHRSAEMVRKYIKAAETLSDLAADGLGL